MASASTNILPLTGDAAVDVITNGTRWILSSDRTVTWSISDGYNGEYWISPSQVIEYIGNALDVISYYADISFEYVGYYADPDAAYLGGSNINVSMDGAGAIFNSSSVWAGAYFPHDGFSPSPALTGDVFLNLNSPANSLRSYDPGSQGWFLLLHELGHALGLKHTHDDGLTGRPTLNSLNLGQFDRDWLSVMSYNDDFDFNQISFDPATPMLLDVIGLQYLYGKNLNTNTGNSIYELDSYQYYYTIWDAEGNDTISAANAKEGWHIVLPYAVVSFAIREKFGYALPTADLSLSSPTFFAWMEGDIENAVGSAYGDWIDGNGLENRLSGGSGDDVILGRGGNDLLYGGPDNDVLRGGGGEDVLRGGPGDDSLFGGPGGDHLLGGGDSDVLRGAGGEDDLRGGPGDDRLFGGPDGDVLLGGGDIDILRSGGGNDIMRGHAGDDRLFGAAGNDNQHGGGGNDIMRGGGGHDILRGGPGTDALLGGGGHDRLIGGNHDDALYGGAGNDLLFGNGGHDRLVGGTGDDRLLGGAGDDVLIGGADADIFVFQPNGGHDVVIGFQDTLDLLDFRAFGFASKGSVLNLATQAGADVVFTLPGGETVELTDFDITLLGGADIVI